jgi:hypothetical protein
VYSYSHKGEQTVYLIDTPGFDDTHRSDTDVLKDIAFFLNSIYAKKIKLAGLIYLHRITDVRMQGSALKNLHMFERLCGEDCFPHIVLATTMWGILGQNGMDFDVGVEREKTLRSDDKFWGYMEKKGSRVMRHDRNTESAQEILSYLLDKRVAVVLDIQRQMVDEAQTLDETAAGQFVQKELIEARKRYEKDLADFQESMEYAMKEKDDQLMATISEQQRQYEAKIVKADADKNNLKINFQKLVEEKDQQYNSLIKELERERATRDDETERRATELRSISIRLAGLERTLEEKDREYRQDITRVMQSQRAKEDDQKRLSEMWEIEKRKLEAQISRERRARMSMEEEQKERAGRGNGPIQWLKWLLT